MSWEFHRGRAWLSGALLALAVAGASARPNILLILADDLGYSDIGCYGGEIPTPNLDRLAAEGVRFRQFYNTARCCPSRASLLTGLYAHKAGVGHMMGGPDKYPGYGPGLHSTGTLTLAEMLKGAGYDTFMSGKWHVTRQTRADGPKVNWPLQRGFDKYYGTIEGFGSFWDPATLTRGNDFISPFVDAEYKPAQYFYTNALADNAVAMLEEWESSIPADSPLHNSHFVLSVGNKAEKKPEREGDVRNPFFLYLAFTAPHWPLHATEEDIAKFRGKYDSGYDAVRQGRIAKLRELGLLPGEAAPTTGDWDAQKHKAWEARCMEVYAAQVYRMDQEIGKVLDHLRGSGELDNTLVMFLSDNGACPEDVGRLPSAPYKNYEPMADGELQKKIWPPMQTRDGHAVKTGTDAMPGPADSFAAYGENWANVSDTPFRMYKHYVHEGGINTPCIVRWPGVVPEERHGKIVKTPGHIIDVMPTFAEAAGTSFPAEYKGRPTGPTSPGMSLVPALTGANAARGGMLFWEHESNRAVRDGDWKLVCIDGKDWELYNLSADPTELKDLAKGDPGRVKRMAAAWDDWAAENDVLPLHAWKQDGTPPEPATTQTRFVLKSGDVLQRGEGPVIGGREFTVTAKVSGWSADADGVIVSHGEAKNGWALFAREGRPCFLMRWKHEYVLLPGDEVLTSGLHTIVAKVGEEGRMTLTVDGQPMGRRRPPGFVLHTPVNELRVGDDRNGLVGEALKGRQFTGEIEEVVISF